MLVIKSSRELSFYCHHVIKIVNVMLVIIVLCCQMMFSFDHLCQQEEEVMFYPLSIPRYVCKQDNAKTYGTKCEWITGYRLRMNEFKFEGTYLHHAPTTCILKTDIVIANRDII